MIGAMTPSYGIGYKGLLPWESVGYTINQDLKHFQLMTRSTNNCRKAVVMGSNTWMSIPKNHRPLSGRTNYVLTNSINPIDAYKMSDIHDCIQHAISTRHDELWVIGGEQVYQEFIKRQLIRDIWLTVIHGEFPADRYFPYIQDKFIKISEIFQYSLCKGNDDSMIVPITFSQFIPDYQLEYDSQRSFKMSDTTIQPDFNVSSSKRLCQKASNNNKALTYI